MSASLEFKEIPGFADALRREAAVRQQAWVEPHTRICGVRVRKLTLRDIVILEEIRNGFFCPWRFDDDEEFLSHCAQLVWWLSDCPKPDFDSKRAFQPLVAGHRKRLLDHLARQPERLAKDVADYLKTQFLDAPKGSSGTGGQAIAATPAYIADTLAAAGLFEGMDKLMDAPVVQTWQLLRLAARRVYGVPATNESDRIACDFLGNLNGKN